MLELGTSMYNKTTTWLLEQPNKSDLIDKAMKIRNESKRQSDIREEEMLQERINSFKKAK